MRDLLMIIPGIFFGVALGLMVLGVNRIGAESACRDIMGKPCELKWITKE